MNPQELQQKLTDEYNEFMRQKFPHELPEWVLQKFPEALMSIPQSTVPYHAERIQHILSQTVENLSIFDIGIVVNVLLAVKPEIFGWSIEEFLMKRTELEQARAYFTTLTSNEEKRLQKKKVALENMGGQINNNNNNGMVKV